MTNEGKIIFANHLSVMAYGFAAYGVVPMIFRIESTTAHALSLFPHKKSAESANFIQISHCGCEQMIYFFHSYSHIKYKIQHTLHRMYRTVCEAAGGQNKCMTCGFFPFILSLRLLAIRFADCVKVHNFRVSSTESSDGNMCGSQVERSKCRQKWYLVLWTHFMAEQEDFMFVRVCMLYV